MLENGGWDGGFRRVDALVSEQSVEFEYHGAPLDHGNVEARVVDAQP